MAGTGTTRVMYNLLRKALASSEWTYSPRGELMRGTPHGDCQEEARREEGRGQEARGQEAGGQEEVALVRSRIGNSPLPFACLRGGAVSQIAQCRGLWLRIRYCFRLSAVGCRLRPLSFTHLPSLLF
jgi:hypothetical protein